MRLQRGGVGFYPTAGTPFVHMDVGGVRHWPRMSYDQLARLFPDGKTVHIPSNGQPLPGYEVARAELEARGDSSLSDREPDQVEGLLRLAVRRRSDEDEDAASEGGRGGRSSAPARNTRIAMADRTTDASPAYNCRPRMAALTRSSPASKGPHLRRNRTPMGGPHGKLPSRRA